MKDKPVLRFAIVAGAVALAGCQDQSEPRPAEEPTGEQRSIFRPEFQVEPIQGLDEPESLEMVIQFPEGLELTEEARAELATVLSSQQVEGGGNIILRGHSDSGGSDEVNMRISRERAETVAQWLIDNGVAADRIEVIAFGEQNPVAPNALPDGSPNEEGRATNRRVEIEVHNQGQAPQVEERTLAESLATAAEEGEGEGSESRQ